MKIALIGYGKMGMAIEEIALQKGHEIVLRIGLENLEEFTHENLQQAKKLYYEQELKIKSMKTDRENLNPNTSNYPHKFSSQN